MKTPTVVSVINLKGGVGKTTVTALLARYAAAEWGLDVLAVDLDPQANLSQALMTNNDYDRFMREQKLSIVELFGGYAPPAKNKPSPSRLKPADIIQQVSAGWGNADGEGGMMYTEIVPSRFDFSDNLIKSIKDVNEKVLARFIADHMQDKDLILIDCAPTESILTRASYHASRYVLIPVKTEFFSTIGFPLLKKSLDRFREENPGHQIDVCGVLINDTSTKESYSQGGRESADAICKEAAIYGWDIFQHMMTKSEGYSKMARTWAPDQRGDPNAYREWPEIANEILAKIGFNNPR